MTTPKPLCVPLFVPGHRPELLVKAGASGADAVILDLEDAVADADKPAAHATLMSRSDLPVPLVVRCNGFDSSWCAKDVAALAKNPPQMIMLPRAESVDHLEVITKQLGVDMPIIPIVESALGLAAIKIRQTGRRRYRYAVIKTGVLCARSFILLNEKEHWRQIFGGFLK